MLTFTANSSWKSGAQVILCPHIAGLQRLAPQLGRVVLEGFWFALYTSTEQPQNWFYWFCQPVLHIQSFFCTQWHSLNSLVFSQSAAPSSQVLFWANHMALGGSVHAWGPRENNSGQMCNWCSVGSFVNLNRWLNEDSGVGGVVRKRQINKRTGWANSDCAGVWVSHKSHDVVQSVQHLTKKELDEGRECLFSSNLSLKDIYYYLSQIQEWSDKLKGKFQPYRSC